MPRRSLGAAAALALALTMPLTACGGSNEPGVSASPASSAPGASESSGQAEPSYTPEPAVSGSDIHPDKKPGALSPEAGAYKLVQAAAAKDWDTSCKTLSAPDIAELEGFGGAPCAEVLAKVDQEGNVPVPAAFTNADQLTYTVTYHGEGEAVVAVSDGKATFQTHWLREGERWFGGYLR